MHIRYGNRVTILYASFAILLAACSGQTTGEGSTLSALPTNALDDIGPVVPETTISTASATIVRETLSASWAMSYDSVAAISRDADLIVVATVVGIGDVTTDSRIAGNVTATITFTDFELSSEETLKGAVQSGNVIVRQTGNRAGTKIVEVRDDPLMEVGARYLLFLKSGSPGKYFVAGGPDGRMVVESGLVYSLSAKYPAAGIDDVAVVAQPLDAVKALVAAATK